MAVAQGVSSRRPSMTGDSGARAAVTEVTVAELVADRWRQHGQQPLLGDIATISLGSGQPVPLAADVADHGQGPEQSEAAAGGARFIRVNVLTGVMYTDQGPIIGKAAEAQTVVTYADGVIVGSAFVRRVLEAEHPSQAGL